MPDSRPRNQDVGAIEQRVFSTEQSIVAVQRQLTDSVTSIRQDMSSGLSGLASQISDFARRYDDVQRTAAANSKTNWTGVSSVAIASVVAVLGLMTAIGTLAKAPIDAELIRQDRAVDKIDTLLSSRIDKVGAVAARELAREAGDIRENLQKNWNSNARKEYVVQLQQRVEEINERQDRNFVREIARIDDTIKSMINASVTRQETNAQRENYNDRLLALTNRLNDLQKEYGANFTPGDQLKNLQTQVDQLRASIRLTPAPATVP